METKNITETISTNPFANIKEFEGTNKIKGIALMGRRESLNNRHYSDRAVRDIATLGNGAKAYIDHTTKSEQRERSGVRPISAWLGVFSDTHRQGNGVYGDLTIRESHHDLMKSIIELAPSGVGFSIDARVKVFSDGSGKEIVESVDLLRSVDLVSEAALCRGLFESALQQDNQDVMEFVRACTGEEDVDYSAMYNFLEAVKSGKERHGELICMPGYNYDNTENRKKLSRKEVAEALEKYFNIDIDETERKLKGKRIDTVDDFIALCR